MLEHLELQHADHADDDLLKADARALEGLDGALLGELHHALDELLALEAVHAGDAREELRRKDRDARVAQLSAGGQRVAQREDARVEQADDVAGVGVFHGLALVGHELLRLLELDRLVGAAVPDGHALGEHARADAHERQPVAVGGVHVRLNLEDEAGEVRVGRLHGAHIALVRGGRGGVFEEAGEERLHAEVGDGRAEEHRRERARAHLLEVEGVARHIQQLDFVHQAGIQALAEHLRERGIVNRQIRLLHAGLAVVAALVELDHPRVAVVHALEVAVRADGPVDRAGADAQHLLKLLHQGERVLRGAVHLVDEGEDRDIAQAADLEELDGLRLHALGRVDEHHGAVRRDEHAVGVLREVLVAGGIQNVDVEAVELKLHRRGGDGDAALLLDLHPVAGGVLIALAGLDGARRADGTRVEQQLLRQRRLARVGVGDDGERAAAGGLALELSGHKHFRHEEILLGSGRWPRESHFLTSI